MSIKFVFWAFLIILSGGLCAARAQSPLWGGLKPGPYAVGFRVLWKYDYSRTWKPEVDYKGNPLSGEAARPVRISVWYPAQKSAQASPMPYSGYLHIGVPDQSFADF